MTPEQKAKYDLFQIALPKKNIEARNWFINKLPLLYKNKEELDSLNSQKFMPKGKVKTTSKNIIGKMFFYHYDPKLRLVLPFFDVFPLVIPIEMYSDGFLGLNLHYLAPRPRAELLQTLLYYRNNSKMNDTTKMKVSYDLLHGIKNYFLARPCIKRYLYTHIRSKMMEVYGNEWDVAVFLPVEAFYKKTKFNVWANSLNKSRT